MMNLEAPFGPRKQTRAAYLVIFRALDISLLLFLLALALAGRAIAQSGNARLAPAQIPLATLDGQPIFEDQLEPQVREELGKLRQDEQDLERRALEALVVQKLAEADAKKNGVTLAQYLTSEVDSKVPEPTPDEVNAYYLARQDEIKQSFIEVKNKLQQALKNMKLQQARQAFADDLLARAEKAGEVVVLLREPRVQMAYDANRFKGSPTAQVMIVEFSDFGCPFCRKAESSLSRLLSKYAGKVSLAYRDYPLPELHPTAEAAAEASRCAEEQGKFWEYHDLLFGNSEKQDREGLLLDARILQLDEARFAACLDGAKYKEAIDQDRQDGARAGVIGTPGFFINGIFLDGAQPIEAFEKIIDRELSAAGANPSASEKIPAQ